MTNVEPKTAHSVIPGGAHTYSKGDDQFPANAPRFLERGAGAYVWDEHDRKYLDWTMGLRTMTLGYGIPEVDEAAIAQIRKGANFGRPSRIEMDTAQDIIDLIPGAEMIKFAKNGSSVTTGAVKLARAYTGRDKVAICAEHPFFSYDDWFIGATACDAGIPQATKDLTVKFHYNDIASVEAMFAANKGEIAALIMEAANVEEPAPGFLLQVQNLCRENGTVFIVDEMISGFRWHLNGAQTLYGLDPDLSTFGKGIANGFAVAALAGKREIMNLGSLFSDKPRVFLMSTTHGAENHALAACRAALKFYRERDVVTQLWKSGGALMDGFNAAAKDAGIADHIACKGFACSPWIMTKNREGQVDMGFRTLFLQEMVREGVLINYIAPSWSHREEEIAKTIDAARKAFTVYARALETGLDGLLEGPAVRPVFRKYN